MADQKEPFVGQGDRPEVSLKPDAPISGLTVRDLGALLGEAAKVSLKYLKVPGRFEQWADASRSSRQAGGRGGAALTRGDVPRMQNVADRVQDRE